MNRRTLWTLCACMAFCMLLGGCRDYHGLDELTIVAGIAVDEAEDAPDEITVTFEVIDLQSNTDGDTPETKLLQSTGKSLADAVNKANAKLYSNMYFGNCEVLVVSHQLAESRGLSPFIDSLLRDNETRDNLHVLISGEKTAAEIITPPEDSSLIVSFNININVDTEEHPANSTRALELYQIYNRLALETSSLAVPVINFDQETGEQLQLDGMAVFTGDKLTGYLPEEELPFYLLGVSKIKGGGYHIAVGEGGEYATLVNRKSTPRHRVDFDGERFRFTISIDVTAAVTEFSPGWEDVSYAAMRELELTAADYLAGRVLRLADDYRSRGYDLYELGDCVRNREPFAWREVSEDWRDWLGQAEIAVVCTVKIDNTGLIERYEAA